MVYMMVYDSIWWYMILLVILLCLPLPLGIPGMHSLSNMWLPGATSNLASDSWILDTTDTVDRRNPAPVEVGSLSQYLQGFILPGGAGFQPSTVPLVVLKLHFQPPPAFASVENDPFGMGGRAPVEWFLEGCTEHVLLWSPKKTWSTFSL